MLNQNQAVLPSYQKMTIFQKIIRLCIRLIKKVKEEVDHQRKTKNGKMIRLSQIIDFQTQKAT